MKDRIKQIHTLSKQPMTSDKDTRRVEIIMLKFNEEPKVIDEAISRIVNQTKWPYKLVIYDNRPNSANTSRIWNKLIRESTCDYVCVIDSDAFVPEGIEPCWLTRMMESIEEEPVVLPMGDNVGGANKATGAEPYPSSRPANGVWSGYCFLLNRPTIYKDFGVKPFDEDFYIYGQDSEFAHRTLKKRCAIFRTDVFVQHMGSYSFKKAETEGVVDREADKMYAASLYRLKTKGILQ